ncbi:type IV secretion system protein [Micromonospora sp. NPDC052213]|uniref:type IV secretion system protein n=1 Tax=Micromonospora sp. NPDC052213 TaxID=3155812 RepID=UPI0034489105
MVDWLMNGLVSWLAEKVTDLLGGLLAFLASSIFISPDVTVLPQVTSIPRQERAGRQRLLHPRDHRRGYRHDGRRLGRDALPHQGADPPARRRVRPVRVRGPADQRAHRIANALTVSMTGTSAPTTEAVTFVKVRIASAMTDESAALLMAIVGLLIVVLMFMLVGSWLARIGVLIVLAGIAPVALACYATPWTQGVAELWWRTLLGCLATPTLQAVAFSAGINLLIDPGSNLPILLGLPGSDALNLGWALNFPLTPLAIGTETAIVLAAFLAATALARRWSVTATG